MLALRACLQCGAAPESAAARGRRRRSRPGGKTPLTPRRRGGCGRFAIRGQAVGAKGTAASAAARASAHTCRGSGGASRGGPGCGIAGCRIAGCRIAGCGVPSRCRPSRCRPSRGCTGCGCPGCGSPGGGNASGGGPGRCRPSSGGKGTPGQRSGPRRAGFDVPTCTAHRAGARKRGRLAGASGRAGARMA